MVLGYPGRAFCAPWSRGGLVGDRKVEVSDRTGGRTSQMKSIAGERAWRQKPPGRIGSGGVVTRGSPGD